jgi:mitogen-activated protein kinase 7
VDQLSKIFDILGTPQDPTLMQFCSSRVLKYIKSWSKKNKLDWKVLLPQADPQALDLLDKLLAFDPTKRLPASDALEHSYLAPYHYPDVEVNFYIFIYIFFIFILIFIFLLK